MRGNYGNGIISLDKFNTLMKKLFILKGKVYNRLWNRIDLW